MSTTIATLVEVNESRCRSIARLLRSKNIPEDREEIRFEHFSDVEIGNLLFFVVAICHQTTVPGYPPLAGVVGDRVLRGWDYLFQRFVQASRIDRSWLDIKRWQSISADDIRSLYRNSEGEDLLRDVENRAQLIVDLGNEMLHHKWLYLQSIYEYCNRSINTGIPNLVETLGLFKAYSDPVRKKSYFLLSLMRNTGIWTYSDPQHLGPPVDYHEVRGHLRIGTVTIVDEVLKNKLLNRQSVSADEDLAIRGAVFNAIMLISEETGLKNPSKLHYLFWNVLRNFCTREDPNCLGERRETYLPARYQHLAILRDGKGACPFSQNCASVDIANRLSEHVFETDYY